MNSLSSGLQSVLLSPPYKIFISHSWNYSDSYSRLKTMLSNQPDFKYTDFSIPKDAPIHNQPNDLALYNEIKKRIDNVDIVLILAGVYATYSKWINLEIKAAKSPAHHSHSLLDYISVKPILAIEEWGSQKSSQVVKEESHEIVQWNGISIINSIKRLVKR